MMLERVYAEGGEGREHDKDRGPAVVEREWKVNEDFVGDIRGLVVLLHNVVNVSYRGGDEECEDERCIR